MRDIAIFILGYITIASLGYLGVWWLCEGGKSSDSFHAQEALEEFHREGGRSMEEIEREMANE